jgi:hypothetical protein
MRMILVSKIRVAEGDTAEEVSDKTRELLDYPQHSPVPNSRTAARMIRKCSPKVLY